MLGELNWDRYWRFELFRRRCDPLDFRRWKRDSQRELKALYPGRPRLLDATAGLGDHTVNLAEEGFEVTACDTSAVAREATAAALSDAGLDVPVIATPWAELGARPERYDLVFNDALHWTYDEATLRAGSRGCSRRSSRAARSSTSSPTRPSPTPARAAASSSGTGSR